jgi:hypothetical protein
MIEYLRIFVQTTPNAMASVVPDHVVPTRLNYSLHVGCNVSRTIPGTCTRNRCIQRFFGRVKQIHSVSTYSAYSKRPRAIRYPTLVMRSAVHCQNIPFAQAPFPWNPVHDFRINRHAGRSRKRPLIERRLISLEGRLRVQKSQLVLCELI